MKRFAVGSLLFLLLSNAVPGKLVPSSCGTYRENWKEQSLLHKKALKVRKAISPKALRPELLAAASTNRDVGNIAVIDDEGVVATPSAFDLGGKTLAFLPSAANAAKYRFQVGEGSYDMAIADAGAKIDALGDDDTREIALPFSFPFFGSRYQKLYVNSDGNLTFGSADGATGQRSLGRMAAGPPRIAPLFSDLDPTKTTKGVRVYGDSSRFVVSWADVPEYEDYGPGMPQTFQVRLFPDGKIEYAYSKVTVTDAAVGVSPGYLQGSMNVLSFSEGSTQEFSAMVAEYFTQTLQLDVVTAAQKFYQTHEDSYDYLLIFNGLGIQAADGAVAYELSVRTKRAGIGDNAVDVGEEYGSARRLQAVTNMGPLSQYPQDPYAVVPRRSSQGDTTMSAIAHEVGHLFLAFASVRNPSFPDARPMLGRQSAHWAFTFNSEASFLEGNKIEDQGDVRPRFMTTATVQQYAPLDQYLMGLRAPEDVPSTFLVESATVSPLLGPAIRVPFDGSRRDVAVNEIIRAEGRRVPDHTVEQRNYRMAFVLIVHKGVDARSDQLAQIELYRSEFEKYYAKATDERATADTSIKRSLRVSTFPAAGVILGETLRATVSTASPLLAPLTLALRTGSDAVQAPASVAIPAGSSTVSFDLKGLRAGVDDLVITPADSGFETVFTKVQVTAAVKVGLRVFSGNRQKPVAGTALPDPIVFKVTDPNEVPYSGVRVRVSVTGGGSVQSDSAVSDDAGLVSFRWTPGSGPVNQLTASVDGAGSGQTAVAIALGAPQIAAGAVVNAASFASGITPGGLASVYGTNLSAGYTDSARPPYPTELDGVMITLDSNPVPLVYVSDTQINFYVPADVAPGQSTLVIQNAGGTSLPIRVPVLAIQPGIFFDSTSGLGAILIAGTGRTTVDLPASAGDVLEIYCTGLGPVSRQPSGLSATDNEASVRIGNASAQVLFSGLAPGFVGLYQVNAIVPAGFSKLTTLQLTIQGQASNEVKVNLR